MHPPAALEQAEDRHLADRTPAAHAVAVAAEVALLSTSTSPAKGCATRERARTISRGLV
jgi:hypothetical protein